MNYSTVFQILLSGQLILLVHSMFVSCQCFGSSTPPIRAPFFAPTFITTPQPPFGCSQVNPWTIKDVFLCFSKSESSRRRAALKKVLPSPDSYVTVDKLIRNHGYPVETHKVTSKDGYISTLFRIPHGKHSKVSSKGPVLLQHGLFASSIEWFLNVPDEKSLGFLLADSGYDVWLGNSRGTKYSQGHVKLNPVLDVSYWDFSWHEMGKYDLPATIDYILTNQTGKRLFYIGHSMGTTMFLTGLSSEPTYNEKIKMAFLLAPTVFMGNSTHATHLGAFIGYHLQPILRYFNGLPFDIILKLLNIIKAFYPICEAIGITCTVCRHAFFAFAGFDYEQLNFDQIPLIVSHLPDKVSIQSALHYGQSMVTGDFREFDYGPKQNPKRYKGQCMPPRYNLSKVEAPVVLFWGWNDNFATPNDVKKLTAALPNVASVEIPHCAFNHFDFTIAKDADIFIYKRILKDMDNFK